MLGRVVCIYTYPGGTWSVSELWLPSPSAGGTGWVLGQCGTGRGGGAPIPMRLQGVCAFIAVPLWQGRLPSVWFSQTIAGSLSITAVNLLCSGYTAPRLFSSQTLVRGFLISCYVFSLAAHEHPPLAILAIFKARRMFDCSSCTWPPCLAIVTDMLKTYKKLVAASRVRFRHYNNHIRSHSPL